MWLIPMKAKEAVHEDGLSAIVSDKQVISVLLYVLEGVKERRFGG